MGFVQIKKQVVGIDIDIQITTIAVVDIRGNIIATMDFPTDAYPDASEYIATLCEKVVALVEDNGGYESIRSVGVSAPSANYLSGSIENAANLPWKGVIPLAAIMRDRLGISVAVANDCHVSALGESVFGSAHGMKNFVVMLLGYSGVGSCFFSNGHPHLGTDGFAGEIGHTALIDNGRQCGCGKKGCLETYTSVKGILLTVKELLESSSVPSLLRGCELKNLADVFAACDKGDVIAIEAMKRSGDSLGRGLANYASVLDPEAIILTGEAAQGGKWLLDPLLDSFETHVFHNIRDKVKIVVSHLNDKDRRVLGASALAWDVKEYSLFK
jgi:glucokinase